MKFLYLAPSDPSRFYMRSWASIRRCSGEARCDRSRSVRSKSIDHRAKRTDRKEQPMLDVILIAGGIGFFILSIAYAYGCDRL
jgi:hypothetical protein